MINSQQIDFSELYQAADRATRLLRTLANPERLMILCKLAGGESCVSDLETALKIRQPTLSQQLTVLREEGLVSVRREGRHMVYRLSSNESLAVIRTLREQFCPQPVDHRDSCGHLSEKVD